MPVEYVIDGSRITSLETFYDEITRVIVPGYQWGRNLDAFNDILSGSSETPDEGFTLKWSNSSHSKKTLGYSETIRQLEIRLGRCNSKSRDDVRRKLLDARAGVGPTVFDWLVEIITDQGSSGAYAGNKVILLLD